MSSVTTSTVNIAATADAVRAVLFDIANYPSWSSSFKSVTVLESDGQGRPTQVQMGVDAGALKDKPTLNYDWSAYPNRVDFSLEEANVLTEMSGAFIVKDNGDETEVTFRFLDEEEIWFYLKQYQPYDKAGSYGIQEWIGFVGVSSITGSYFTVMGFPLHLVYAQLKKWV